MRIICRLSTIRVVDIEDALDITISQAATAAYLGRMIQDDK
jgi:hypothetical protein